MGRCIGEERKGLEGVGHYEWEKLVVSCILSG